MNTWQFTAATPTINNETRSQHSNLQVQKERSNDRYASSGPAGWAELLNKFLFLLRMSGRQLQDDQTATKLQQDDE